MEQRLLQTCPVLSARGSSLSTLGGHQHQTDVQMWYSPIQHLRNVLSVSVTCFFLIRETTKRKKKVFSFFHPQAQKVKRWSWLGVAGSSTPGWESAVRPGYLPYGSNSTAWSRCLLPFEMPKGIWEIGHKTRNSRKPAVHHWNITFSNGSWRPHRHFRWY